MSYIECCGRCGYATFTSKKGTQFIGHCRCTKMNDKNSRKWKSVKSGMKACNYFIDKSYAGI